MFAHRFSDIVSSRILAQPQTSKEVQEKYDNAGSLKGGVVAQHAEQDLLCRKAMEIMMRAYASEAGNAMLKWLPYGGFYITGMGFGCVCVFDG